MRVASILDTGILLAMIPEDAPTVIASAERLTASGSIVLIDNEELACIACDKIGQGKWSVHIFSQKAARGKYLWSFSLQALLWMIENRKLENALFFVRQADKIMKRFLSFYKLKPAVAFDKELLYIVNKREVLDFAVEQQQLITLEV